MSYGELCYENFDQIDKNITFMATFFTDLCIFVNTYTDKRRNNNQFGLFSLGIFTTGHHKFQYRK